METISYTCGNKQRTLKKLTGARAFCLDHNVSRDSEEAGALGNDVFAKNMQYGSDTDGECLAAFEGAGWSFVEPSDTCQNHVQSGKLPKGVCAMGTPCVDHNGSVKVAMPSLNIQFDPEASEAQVKSLIAELELRILHSYRFAPNYFMVELPHNADCFSMAEKYLEHKDTFLVEPELIEYIRVRDRPTPQEVANGWQLKNIEAVGAWEIADGTGVNVAMIDNGCDLKHPDLIDSLTEDTAYFKSRFIGFLSASFERNREGYPDKNHGTFCAGMAAARANRRDGVGVAFNASLTPIACLDDQLGSQSTLARAIAYAAQSSTEEGGRSGGGADIISCSLGPNDGDWEMQSVLRKAIDFAVTEGRGGLGTPVFWAVTNGNHPISSGNDTDEVSAYQHTIAVGRSKEDNTEGGSGFGPELDFLAPGVKVRSTRSQSRGGGTESRVGTSYATPCAAGIAALILSANPRLPWTEVRRIMRESCDKVGGVQYDAKGHHPKYGYGRVNALKAVKMAVGS